MFLIKFLHLIRNTHLSRKDILLIYFYFRFLELGNYQTLSLRKQNKVLFFLILRKLFRIILLLSNCRLNSKGKCRAFINIWFHTNITVEILYDLLANIETKTNSWGVYAFSCVQFSKLGKEMFLILFFNTYAGVLNFWYEGLIDGVVFYADFYEALNSKLNCILN